MWSGYFYPFTKVKTVEDEVAVAEEVKEVVLNDLEKEHYEEIKRLSILVGEAAYDHDLKKIDAKAAKEHLDSLQMRLHAFINEGPRKPDPQKELPFDEAWRDKPIVDVLKLTAKQTDKLEEAGVKTVGQFENLRAGQVDKYPDGLRSVKGFGQSTVDAMEADILVFLSTIREPEGVDNAMPNDAND